MTRQDLLEELEECASEIMNLTDELKAAEHHLDELSKYVAYVDATHPELRTAYKVANILEGEPA
jgi:hypothetical protein